MDPEESRLRDEIVRLTLRAYTSSLSGIDKAAVDKVVNIAWELAALLRRKREAATN